MSAICAGGHNAFHLAGHEAGARRGVLSRIRFAKAASCGLDGGSGSPMDIGLERLGKTPLAIRFNLAAAPESRGHAGHCTASPPVRRQEYAPQAAQKISQLPSCTCDVLSL